MHDAEINRDIRTLLNEFYCDNRINNEELQILRDFADERFDLLLSEFGENNSLSAFQKSTDVTVQLMQQSFFDIKKKCNDQEDKKVIKEAFVAQLVYIIANYNRFFANI
ncbi:TPA: hypothetical protein U5E37_004081 [Yersinia enterocolitica]|nr:hypothetical protein [Yersinia enterocolitica]HEN3574858.1 hypothetical protein [Yersinia enterocolitica]HEN3619048.1 hypothetical protein [Yersinia enterocolitica]HEN3629584.1 hypothetical protein [Yersinia enterocolitica]HEN3651911.1 hypothetical protein [Yersinia enterocolitica]